MQIEFQREKEKSLISLPVFWQWFSSSCTYTSFCIVWLSSSLFVSLELCLVLSYQPSPVSGFVFFQVGFGFLASSLIPQCLSCSPIPSFYASFTYSQRDSLCSHLYTNTTVSYVKKRIILGKANVSTLHAVLTSWWEPVEGSPGSPREWVIAWCRSASVWLGRLTICVVIYPCLVTWKDHRITKQFHLACNLPSSAAPLGATS